MKVRNREIDKRYVPPVKGVDLEQALNYLRVSQCGVKFAYEEYTSRRIFYTPGSRPSLERIVGRLTADARSDFQKIKTLAEYVSRHVRWAGYYEKDKGRPLVPNRNASEEDIIKSGYGWCHEQARVYCAFTQICGISSRIIFASNPKSKYGHVVAEVLLSQGWMAVDQSLGFCFRINGSPVRAWDIFHEKACFQHFSPVYKRLCARVRDDLGDNIMKKSFAMSVAENPLDGFEDIGIHNYFLH